MSKSVLPALAAALTLILGAAQVETAHAAQQSAPTPDLSESLRPIFRSAQAAQKAKRWPEVIAKAQEVLASSKRKPDDTYYAYYLLFDANRALGNRAEQLKSLRGLVDSGFLNTTQAAQYVNAVMGLAFQAKDYDTAIEYGTRLTKTGNANPRVFTTIGQSYFLKGDYSESARFFRSLVDEQVKRGQKPLEQNLVMLHSSYEKLHNRAGVTHALEMLVVYYPKEQYWDALLYSVRSDPDLEPREKLQVYRLMWATGTLKLAQDYNKFAEYALLVGLPAEAQKIYEAGLKANVFKSDTEKSRAERLMGSAAKAAAAERAKLPKMEADAASASTGEDAVVLGMAYYSYGQYDKSIEALQSALEKGGLKDDLQVEVSLVLGMAQLRAKDTAGAVKTFRSIKTDNDRMQRVADLWELYAR
jgi:tetratricopeptide (TPR) repeat protein